MTYSCKMTQMTSRNAAVERCQPCFKLCQAAHQLAHALPTQIGLPAKRMEPSVEVGTGGDTGKSKYHHGQSCCRNADLPFQVTANKQENCKTVRKHTHTMGSAKKNEIPITYIYIYPVIILLFLDLGSICGLGFPAANSYSPPEKDKASLPPKYLPLSTHFGALVAATQPHRPLLRPAWVARDRERRGPANCSPWGSYGSKCH